jgi:hypothetical protein
MLVICKDWYAWINTQPIGPPAIHVIGGIEVGNPGIDVLLTKRSPTGFNPAILMLDVSLYQKPGMWPQMMTCASARYDETLPNNPKAYSAVEIFHDGKLIAKIDSIDIAS